MTERHERLINESMTEQKRRLRALYIQKRESISDESRLTADRAICRHVVSILAQFSERKERGDSGELAEPQQQPAFNGTVALYAAFRGEADVLGVIPELQKMGWRTALPKTIANTRELHFYAVVPETEWMKGNYGIREPVATAENYVCHPHLDVIVTPGVAFTTRGLRLGYGGGYYDTLFEQNPQAIRIGVGYECQVIDEIPTLSHDVSMHYIITEAGMRRCQHGPSS